MKRSCRMYANGDMECFLIGWNGRVPPATGNIENIACVQIIVEDRLCRTILLMVAAFLIRHRQEECRGLYTPTFSTYLLDGDYIVFIPMVAKGLFLTESCVAICNDRLACKLRNGIAISFNSCRGGIHPINDQRGALSKTSI